MSSFSFIWLNGLIITVLSSKHLGLFRVFSVDYFFPWMCLFFPVSLHVINCFIVCRMLWLISCRESGFLSSFLSVVLAGIWITARFLFCQPCFYSRSVNKCGFKRNHSIQVQENKKRRGHLCTCMEWLHLNPNLLTLDK